MAGKGATDERLLDASANCVPPARLPTCHSHCMAGWVGRARGAAAYYYCSRGGVCFFLAPRLSGQLHRTLRCSGCSLRKFKMMRPWRCQCHSTPPAAATEAACRANETAAPILCHLARQPSVCVDAWSVICVDDHSCCGNPSVRPTVSQSAVERKLSIQKRHSLLQ